MNHFILLLDYSLPNQSKTGSNNLCSDISTSAVLSKMLEQCAHKNPLDYESPNPTLSTGSPDRSKFDLVLDFRMNRQ